MATIGMLACGSFMIASIGVFQKDANIDADQPSSGTGGFELMGEASIAVVHAMNNKTNREDYYSLNEDLLKQVSFVPFRLRDGAHARGAAPEASAAGAGLVQAARAAAGRRPVPGLARRVPGQPSRSWPSRQIQSHETI